MEDLLTINPRMPTSPGKNIASVIGRFGKRLLGFIRQRVSSEADAEDILQDIWYQLTMTVDTEPIEQIGGWLFAVARNKIIDRYRKRQPESLESMLAGGDESFIPDLAGLLPDDSRNPESANLRTLFWKTLQAALDELPQEQRLVFIWNELEGLPFKEIAARTGDKVNTLISRKHYAVLHLRERLTDLYHEINEQ
jgi:RNA polymerase sigma factor (sigma-70 family)